jgi:dihydrofolate reductase
MKRIRYGVAMTLDGFIAGPNGEADWIVMDPEVNFAEIWAQFDTLLMGRRTYEAAIARLGESSMRGPKVVVVSRTLKPSDHPNATIIADVTQAQMQSLRTEPGQKDIWLMGGGALFRTLLEMHQVDTIEVSIMPVALGAGIPLLTPPAQTAKLKLTSHKIYRSGIVSLVYEVQNRPLRNPLATD